MRASDPLSFLLRAAGLGLVIGLLGFIALELARAPAGERGYREAVARAAPAVVNVYSERRVRVQPRADAPLFDEFFGDGDEAGRLQTTVGSGVILDRDGHVVTNHHVVAGAERVEIVLADGRRRKATLVGGDPETDLALLRVDVDNSPAPIARAAPDSLRVGDVVLAIGNPWGVGQAVTLGIVGATGRDRLGLSTFEDFIQHDAAINPGSSGGALVNPRGQLVGINTAIFSRSGGSHGIGFAIPVDLVQEVFRQLRDHGRVIRGWLGVQARDLPPDRAPGREPGLEIEGVFADGPAERAGLRMGDVLLSIDGTDLPDVETLLRATTGMRPGERVTVTYRRDGRRQTTEATLAQRPTP
ncbi:MAG: trypsin-like peptidase domain-containing protein [Halofilum sp. (in: g-proteobacteria)]|nr:trypsin-like peptidase domain-containing protein [Halofilum sp. (in: g-proteobacteria)]